MLSCHLLGWVSGSFCLCHFELAPTSLVFPGMAASAWANQGPLGAFQFFPPSLEKQPTPLNYQPYPNSHPGERDAGQAGGRSKVKAQSGLGTRHGEVPASV